MSASLRLDWLPRVLGDGDDYWMWVLWARAAANTQHRVVLRSEFDELTARDRAVVRLIVRVAEVAWTADRDDQRGVHVAREALVASVLTSVRSIHEVHWGMTWGTCESWRDLASTVVDELERRDRVRARIRDRARDETVSRNNLLETPKHPRSPTGAVRDHPVRCVVCQRRTLNHCARCNEHCTDTVLP